jgi:hypothetical protein
MIDASYGDSTQLVYLRARYTILPMEGSNQEIHGVEAQVIRSHLIAGAMLEETLSILLIHRVIFPRFGAKL